VANKNNRDEFIRIAMFHQNKLKKHMQRLLISNKYFDYKNIVVPKYFYVNFEAQNPINDLHALKYLKIHPEILY
jgi:hypothetical protein